MRVLSCAAVILIFFTCHLEAYFDFNDLIVDMSDNVDPSYAAPSAEPFSENVCPSRCYCNRRIRVSCPRGVTPVTDGCQCCEMCPRQIGDQCNRRFLCDRTKGLECDLTTLTCQVPVTYGRSCWIEGMERQHGYQFQKGCAETCTCNDGAISCKDLCYESTVMPTNMRCSKRAGYYKRVGDCCGRWMCEEEVERDTSSTYYRHDLQANKKSYTPPRVVAGYDCLAQISEWSGCSKTCGVGISTRINSQNKKCRLNKETRSCVIRPCDQQPKKKRRTLDSCMKTWRPRTAEHFVVDGCTSVQSYRPRYCRSCPGYCCIPTATKTHRMEFQCPGSADVVFKRFMTLKKCTCYPGDCRQHTGRVGIVMGNDHISA